MTNTNLPETVTAGTTGHAGFHSALHAEMNRMSRDTGLRTAAALLINGWTLNSGGKAFFRRTDDEVTLYLQGLNGANATSNMFLNAVTSDGGGVSVNFRPSYTTGAGLEVVSPLYRGPSGAEPWYLFYNGGWRAGLASSPSSPVPTIGDSVIQWTYKTRENWPTFLPPAGA